MCCFGNEKLNKNRYLNFEFHPSTMLLFYFGYWCLYICNLIIEIIINRDILKNSHLQDLQKLLNLISYRCLISILGFINFTRFVYYQDNSGILSYCITRIEYTFFQIYFLIYSKIQVKGLLLMTSSFVIYIYLIYNWRTVCDIFKINKSLKMPSDSKLTYPFIVSEN